MGRGTGEVTVVAPFCLIVVLVKGQKEATNHHRHHCPAQIGWEGEEEIAAALLLLNLHC